MGAHGSPWCRREYVRVDDHGFEAVYGLWPVATVWANVADVERTGPYRAWKVAGPARLSWADRGITMAATTSGGVCLRFREPVGGIDPLGVIRHPAVTLGVDDLDAFIRLAQQRIEAAGSATGSGSPPTHGAGGLLAPGRAVWRWNRRHIIHEQQAVERGRPAVARPGRRRRRPAGRDRGRSDVPSDIPNRRARRGARRRGGDGCDPGGPERARRHEPGAVHQGARRIPGDVRRRPLHDRRRRTVEGGRRGDRRDRVLVTAVDPRRAHGVRRDRDAHRGTAPTGSRARSRSRSNRGRAATTGSST